jgi:hypothetical protein
MARTGLDHSSILSASNAKLHNPICLPTNKRDCILQLREARIAVREIVAVSFQRRDQERQQRIQELGTSRNKSDARHAKLLRRLQRAEEIKLLFEKIRSVRDKGQRQGVTRIEIPVHPESDPKTCSEWQTIDVPTEIVEQLQRRNRAHFGQAHNTPFTIPPLSDDLGFCGDRHGAIDILNGRYDHSPFHDHIQLLLKHLKQTQEMANLRSYPTITSREFIGKLKVWKESTTTSPSGMHLGHYKALIARHRYSEVQDSPAQQNIPANEGLTPQQKRDKWNHMQQELLHLHLTLINYALERGYSFQRWQTIANTILFKDKDSVKIHRTRVIHIYEADFNLILGLKWRLALYQAEALKQLNDGQYGSRPRRNAVDPVMIEELQFEISRISRRMFLQTNYDATACYDRIIPNLAMVTSRKFGVHERTTNTNASTLHTAKYKIRTELGLSATHYSHQPEAPIYGTGQGSGNSPMIWCFLSSLLFDAYEERAYPATYCNPDGSNASSLAMIGFVDDSNGQVNCFQESQDLSTLHTLVKAATHNAVHWAGLLGATGGALELSKCSYHILYWKFHVRGDPVLANVAADVPSISVTDPLTKQVYTLDSIPPTHPTRPWGISRNQQGLKMLNSLLS